MLSLTAFEKALERGHGRALAHVRQHGLAGVEGSVLAACLEDKAYDPQCEPSRAAWLFEMFRQAEAYPRFSRAIQTALRNRQAEGAEADLLQLSGLAVLMAQQGDHAVAEALRDQVLGTPGAPSGITSWSAPALIELEGMPAIIDIARGLGRQIRAEPESWIPYLDEFAHSIRTYEAEAVLQHHARTDRDIRFFLEQQQENIRHVPVSTLSLNSEQNRRERNRREWTLEKILLHSEAHQGQIPGNYMVFGKYATTEELQAVFERLLAASDTEVCLRLLWIFRRARLPALPPRIWAFAGSEIQALRDAALTALSHCCDPQVGEWGRAFLRTSGFSADDSEVISLFTLNYQPGDEALIGSGLKDCTPDNDQAHAIAMALIDFYEANPLPVLADLLIWVYENSPCSVCRYEAVKALIALEALPASMQQECCDDGSEKIRALVAEQPNISAL